MNARPLRAMLLAALALAGCSRDPASTDDHAAGAPRAAPRVRVVPQLGPIQPRRLSFAPRRPARLAVVEADGTVSLWAVDTPHAPRCTAWISTPAADAVFAGDGATLLVAGRDGMLSWWGADGTAVRHVEQAHDGGIRAVSARGEWIVTGGGDGRVRVWNGDGTPRGTPLGGTAGAVLSVAVSPRGDIAAFGLDQRLRLWTVDGGAHREAATLDLTTPRFAALLPNLLRLDVNWGWGRALAFDADGGRLAVAAFDGGVRLLRPDGTPLAAPAAQAHRGLQVQTVASAVAAPEVVSAGHDGTLQRWQANGRRLGAPIAAHAMPAVGVAVSPDGALIASAGMDDRIRLWSPDGTRLGELPARARDRLPGLAVRADGRLVATLDQRGRLRVWTRTAQPHGELVRAADRGRGALVFAPRGDRLAAACSDASVCVWDAEARPIGAPLTGLGSEATALAFDADGAALAAGTRYSALHVLPLTSAAAAWRPEGARGLVAGLAFTPDGARLAAASEVLRIWSRAPDWRSEAAELHGGQALALAAMPDGEGFATAGVDAEVRLWTRDGMPMGAPLVGHGGPVTALAFADVRTLLAGGEDGSVRIWNLRTQQARRVAVGPPVSAVGAAGELIWAATRRGSVQFLAASGEPVATLLIEPDGAVIVAGDGAYAASGALAASLLAYDAAGAAVAVPPSDERAVAARLE